MGAEQYVSEFLDFHAANVDPTAVSCSAAWFEELSKLLPKDSVLTKLGLCMAQYNPDAVLTQTRPLPDLCRCISVAEMCALSKEKDRLQLLEAMLADTRLKCLDLLAESTNHARALSLLHIWEIQAVRLALSKAMLKTFPTAMVSGKFSAEKLQQLRGAWLQHLEESVGLKGFAEKCGLEPINPETAKKDEDTPDKSSMRLASLRSRFHETPTCQT